MRSLEGGGVTERFRKIETIGLSVMSIPTVWFRELRYEWSHRTRQCGN